MGPPNYTMQLTIALAADRAIHWTDLKVLTALGKILLLMSLLVASASAEMASDRVRVIDPHGRYCFHIDSEWTDDGYDVNSDSITIRHKATEIRLTHNDGCWLMADMSEGDAQEIEEPVFGFGRRRSLTTIQGRYGVGRMALYEGPADESAAGRSSPLFGCADVEHGWMIIEGAVSSSDATEVQRILQEARVDCARPDVSVSSN